MTIRPIRAQDAQPLFDMMCALDEETPFMMYEPGERVSRSDRGGLKQHIESALSGGDFIWIAEADDGAVAGYAWASRGRMNRVRHTAYIVVGIRKAYQRQGIGTEFFRKMDEWARDSGIVRLELTVECANAAALRLYEKSGFVIEGRRPKSMKVDGEFVDEFYMAKIF
ncbi:MAG: GNAT family N-acetyltransferase [Clostridia bacterium]|nr:GNAT family N-acetyltransferase [Clostridia bacterium]